MNRRELLRTYKRVLLTLLFALPLLIGLELLIGESLSPSLKIAIYIFVGGSVVALIEYLRYNKRKKD